MKTAHHPFNNDLLIEFDPQSHTYIDNYDVRYTSVTTFIGAFSHPFNAKQQAWDCSKKKTGEYYGMVPDDIMEMWEKKGDQARLEGSVLHEYVEWLVSGKTQGSNIKSVSERCDKLFIQGEIAVKKLLEKYKFVSAEMIVFSSGIQIAGMIDLLMYDPATNEILVLDWKQNEIISRDSMFDTMFQPVNHLPDDDWSHYSLQLSLYQYIMDINDYFPGLKFRRAIIHIMEDGFRVMKVPYLGWEIQRMFIEGVKK